MNDLDNKIMIANFIGWEVSEKAKTLMNREMHFAEIPFGYFKINPNDLHFDKSWDLLKWAIDKIVNIPFDEVKFLREYMDTNWKFQVDVYMTSEELYKKVVEFVKWYNNVKPTSDE